MSTKTEPKDDLHAKKSMDFLARHGLVANPENYAIAYHYIKGDNRELMTEVSKLFENKVPFTPKTAAYLYGKYINVDRAQKVIDDAASSAQKLLQDVLRVVSNFSTQTQDYNHNVDHYLDDITHKFESDDIKGIVKELITATMSLKQTGEQTTEKLAESTKEIQTLRQNLEEVTQESQHDFLTGVYNRKAFEDLFAAHASAAKEQKKELCLMMIDIDHFKRFNDKFGHLLGDEVLKIVARALTDILKGRDVVARFGGEEFVVILPETPIEGALKVADAIRSTIASKELKRNDTGQHYGVITISIGVARFRIETDDLKSIVKRADDALYRSKREGRNKVTKET